VHAKNCCADNGATTGRISSTVGSIYWLRPCALRQPEHTLILYLTRLYHRRNETMTDYSIHPACVLFPMMPEDELRGKVLGCWCYPARCHGLTLINWAKR